MDGEDAGAISERREVIGPRDLNELDACAIQRID
jgi:hypothetical protein